MKPYLLLVFLAVLASPAACTRDESTSDEAIVLHPSAQDDPAYWPVLQASTRQIKTFDNFETKFFLHATHFSAAFRAAFHQRYGDLYGVEQATFDEATRKAGFFVSLYAPEEEKLDLNNQKIWTIAMEYLGNKYQPVHVQQVQAKHQWSPFFAYITPWSREYFILFEAPAAASQSPEMLKQTPVKMTFSNSDARVSLTW